MYSDIDRTVASAAARQLGLFTRSQAYEAGATPDIVLTRKIARDWVPLSRQVFRLPGNTVTWRQSLLAAVLNHPRALAAGRAGAALHGLDGVTEGRAEVVIPFESNGRSRLSVVHRSRYFEAMESTTVDGIPVQSPAECITLGARGMSEVDLTRLLDTSLRRIDVSYTDMVTVVHRHAGDRLRHIGVLRRLLEERSPDARPVDGTALERKLDQLLDHPVVPSVKRQVRLGLLDTGPSIVDRFIPEWGLVVEADGRTWHTRGEDFERDRRRDNGAAALGLAILRYTWTMLTRDFGKCRSDLLSAGEHRAKRAS